MVTETSTPTAASAPVTLYYHMLFTAGHLKGIAYPSKMTFATVEDAVAFAKPGREYKCALTRGRSRYVIIEPLFQATRAHTGGFNV